MDNNTTIKEQLEQAKSELAQQILPLIDEFEGKTGFSVTRMSVKEERIPVVYPPINGIENQVLITRSITIYTD